LKTKFIPALRRKKFDIDKIWFQQDGATSHTAGDVIQWLYDTFGQNFISYRTENKWLPHSTDLIPLDFFLWGYLKERVYTPPPKTTNELKITIKQEMKKVTPEMCKNVISNFRRVDVIIYQNGRHIEHLL
jgi:hypothetical protein